MLLGAVLAATTLGAGHLVLRLLCVRGAALRWGLSPSLGLATLAIVLSWATALHVPPVGKAMLALILAAAGWAAVVAPHLRRRSAGLREAMSGPLAVAVFAAILPWVLVSIALGSYQVPASNYDGAFHVEVVDLLRGGGVSRSFYPSGIHEVFAALLQPVPWLDTALGSLQLASGLVILAPIAMYGLARTAWGDSLAAAAAALVLALTYQYPYDLQAFAFWPLASSVAMALGAWTVLARYFEDAHWRWVLAAAVLLAGILLVHGTELYTVAIAGLALLVARWRDVKPSRLGWHLLMGVGVGLALAAPYLPTLFGWAQQGGAVESAQLEFTGAAFGPPIGTFGDNWLLLLIKDTGAGLLALVPVRLALIALGAWAVFSARSGRWVVALWGVFVLLTVVFSSVDVPLVRRAFALTFPWAEKDRLAEISAILAALLAGAGVAATVRGLGTARLRWPSLIGEAHPLAWWRVRTLATILAAFLVWGSAVSIFKGLSWSAESIGAYTADDEAALRWLGSTHPNGTLMNAGATDGGIWAPFKAGVRVLSPMRGAWAPADAADYLRRHLADLGSDPRARDLVCALDVRYVYRGARLSPFARDSFSRAELSASPYLNLLYEHGAAAVYGVKLDCPARTED